jgi:hypothetical protein
MFIEHWQNKDNLNVIKFNNFEIASSFCRGNKIRGGTVIYVKQGIFAAERTDIMYLNSELDFEVSVVELKSTDTVYCCVYRSPSGNIDIFFEKLLLLLDIVLKENKFCVICGDININTLDESKHSNILTDILHSYNMKNHVNEPTRVQGLSSTSTCIDHVYSNLTCSLSSRIIKNHIPDHFGIHIQEEINLEAMQSKFC